MEPASLLREARETSWRVFGRKILFFLPGMFRIDGVSGGTRALSITGERCALQCDHCRGRLLASMRSAATPEELVRECLSLAADGGRSVLISGGCDGAGRLPWGRFASAIRKVKEETGLFVAVHSGLVDEPTARALKATGADQALIDVVGDDRTLRDVCHLEGGVQAIACSLGALRKAGLDLVPHVVCGLHFGTFRGEERALEMIEASRPSQVVFCGLMGLPGTPAEGWPPPPAERVAELIARARLALPATPLSLGCARQRGNRRMELLAIDAGVNRMALPSEEAVDHARAYGLEIRYQGTCCSLPERASIDEFPLPVHGGEGQGEGEQEPIHPSS
ncbi:MAG: radical SAM protein [bacterium]